MKYLNETINFKAAQPRLAQSNISHLKNNTDLQFTYKPKNYFKTISSMNQFVYLYKARVRHNFEGRVM